MADPAINLLMSSKYQYGITTWGSQRNSLHAQSIYEEVSALVLLADGW